MFALKLANLGGLRNVLTRIQRIQRRRFSHIFKRDSQVVHSRDRPARRPRRLRVGIHVLRSRF